MSGSRQPRPLAGRRIVITRSVVDNQSLASGFEALGAQVIEVPLIEVLAPLDGGQALREAASRLADYRWVVLTSVNAVNAFAAALAETDPGAWPEHLQVAPVGPTTEAAAIANGWPTVAPPSVATAEQLVAGFSTPESPERARVLAPLAELASDTVTDGLGAKGYSVDRVTAYRTAAAVGDSSSDDTVTDNEVTAQAAAGADAVTFFSPSAVDRFIDRFGVTEIPAAVICIGPSTAARAEANGLSGVVTASPHTEAGVIAAAHKALGAARQ